MAHPSRNGPRCPTPAQQAVPGPSLGYLIHGSPAPWPLALNVEVQSTSRSTWVPKIMWRSVAVLQCLRSAVAPPPRKIHFTSCCTKRQHTQGPATWSHASFCVLKYSCKLGCDCPYPVIAWNRSARRQWDNISTTVCNFNLSPKLAWVLELAGELSSRVCIVSKYQDTIGTEHNHALV